MCLHYLGKFEVSYWAVNAVIKYAFEWFYPMRSLAAYNWPDLNPVDYTVWVCFRSKSIIPRFRTLTNWSDTSSASGPLWVTRLFDIAVREWCQRLRVCVHAGGGHFSTRWNKDCVMWHVRQWLFWETITVSHVCCYLVNHSNGDKCTLNYCINGSIWHFKFPKVVQAHTLGEVDILGTVLLRVSSGTIFTIFNEIGSYLTDREQEKKLAQFFWDTVYILAAAAAVV